MEPKKRFYVEMDRGLSRRLKIIAACQGKSAKQLLNEIVEEYLKKN